MLIPCHLAAVAQMRDSDSGVVGAAVILSSISFSFRCFTGQSGSVVVIVHEFGTMLFHVLLHKCTILKQPCLLFLFTIDISVSVYALPTRTGDKALGILSCNEEGEGGRKEPAAHLPAQKGNPGWSQFVSHGVSPIRVGLGWSPLIWVGLGAFPTL